MHHYGGLFRPSPSHRKLGSWADPSEESVNSVGEENILLDEAIQPPFHAVNRQGSLRHSVFHLVCTSLDGTILTIPYVFLKIGWIPGLLCLGGIAWMSSYSLHFLAFCSRRIGAMSYTETIYKLFGQQFRIGFSCCLFYVLFFLLVGFFVLMEMMARELLDFAFNLQAFSSYFLMTLLLLPILPYLLSDSVQHLKHVASVAFGFYFLLLVTIVISVVYECLPNTSSLVDKGEVKSRTCWESFKDQLYPQKGTNIMTLLPIMMMLYLNQFGFLGIISQFRTPTTLRIRKLILYSEAYITGFAVVIGIAGSLLIQRREMSDALIDNILEVFPLRKEVPWTDFVSLIAIFSRISILLALLATVPILVVPCRALLLEAEEVLASNELLPRWWKKNVNWLKTFLGSICGISSLFSFRFNKNEVKASSGKQGYQSLHTTERSSLLWPYKMSPRLSTIIEESDSSEEQASYGSEDDLDIEETKTLHSEKSHDRLVYAGPLDQNTSFTKVEDVNEEWKQLRRNHGVPVNSMYLIAHNTEQPSRHFSIFHQSFYNKLPQEVIGFAGMEANWYEYHNTPINHLVPSWKDLDQELFPSPIEEIKESAIESAYYYQHDHLTPLQSRDLEWASYSDAMSKTSTDSFDPHAATSSTKSTQQEGVDHAGIENSEGSRVLTKLLLTLFLIAKVIIIAGLCTKSISMVWEISGSLLTPWIAMIFPSAAYLRTQILYHKGAFNINDLIALLILISGFVVFMVCSLQLVMTLRR